MNLPQARMTDILVQSAGKELLVYDLTTNKAFNLNTTAATIFNHCDGKHTFSALKNKHNYTDDLIFLTLDELKRNGLIEGETGDHFPNMTRREAVKRVGLATMIALPVISGLTAPLAIHAQSAAAGTACTCSAPDLSNARLEGCPCTDNRDCCGVCQAATSTCSGPTAGSAGTAAACCPPLTPPR